MKRKQESEQPEVNMIAAAIYAIERDDVDAFQALLNGGFDLESFIEGLSYADERCDQQPLHRAVHSNSNGIFNLLLKAGAKVNAVDESGATPLHYAVLVKNVDMVLALLKQNADPNIEEENGYTPLYEAVAADEAVWAGTAENSEILLDNLLAITKKLLQYGADASHVCQHIVGEVSVLNYIPSFDVFSDKPPLHRDGYVAKIVSLLLESGAEPNLKKVVPPSAEPSYPLEWALTAGFTHTALVLIRNGATLDDLGTPGEPLEIRNPCTLRVYN